MKIIAIAITLMFTLTPAFADELDDGMDLCAKHMHHTSPSAAPITGHTPDLGNPDKGWEHCLVLMVARDNRNAAMAKATEAKRKADEETNPELKKTRDIARKINGDKPQ